MAPRQLICTPSVRARRAAWRRSCQALALRDPRGAARAGRRGGGMARAADFADDALEDPKTPTHWPAASTERVRGAGPLRAVRSSAAASTARRARCARASEPLGQRQRVGNGVSRDSRRHHGINVPESLPEIPPAKPSALKRYYAHSCCRHTDR